MAKVVSEDFDVAVDGQTQSWNAVVPKDDLRAYIFVRPKDNLGYRTFAIPVEGSIEETWMNVWEIFETLPKKRGILNADISYVDAKNFKICWFETSGGFVDTEMVDKIRLFLERIEQGSNSQKGKVLKAGMN